MTPSNPSIVSILLKRMLGPTPKSFIHTYGRRVSPYLREIVERELQSGKQPKVISMELGIVPSTVCKIGQHLGIHHRKTRYENQNTYPASAVHQVGR